MNINLELNKKSLAIGSVLLALLGFIASEFFDVAKKTVSDVSELKTKIVVIENGIDEDKAQWKVLQSLAKMNKEQDIKIEILQMRVKEMSKNKWNEITVRIEGNAMNMEPA